MMKNAKLKMRMKMGNGGMKTRQCWRAVPRLLRPARNKFKVQSLRFEVRLIGELRRLNLRVCVQKWVFFPKRNDYAPKS